MKKLLSWAAFLLGLALVILGWFMWGDKSDTQIFALNVSVSAIVYILLFSDFLIKWRDPKDKSDRRIGNMGVKWLVTFIYVAAAITIMVLSGVFGLGFVTRLFLQLVALVALLAGFAFSTHSSSNIVKVAEQQAENRAGIDVMRRETKALLNDALDKGTIPSELTQRISSLVDEMRYVAPSSSEDAQIAERRYISTIGRASLALTDKEVNLQTLAEELTKAERALKERKATY